MQSPPPMKTIFHCHFILSLGTPFQVAVWKGIWKRNFGRVVTYSELAQSVDKKNACRAVGAACGKC